MEDRLYFDGEKKRKCVISVVNLVNRHPIHWRIELRIEVIDPKLVKIAKNDESWPIWNCIYPIIESLSIVPRKI